MDAHLVGYGSSSDEEGKAKKPSLEMKKAGEKRNFRKRSLTPEQGGERSPNKASGVPDLPVDVPINNQLQTETKSENTIRESPSRKKPSRSRSKSRSPSPSRLKPSRETPQQSPGRKPRIPNKRSRSRSRSSSSSTDKESRSAVDEFGRRIRRQSSTRSKDEDHSSRRRYSRDNRRSRSRSRERDRDRDRGFRRRDHHDRRRDDRDRHRRSRDRSRERSRERSKERSPRRSGGRSHERSRGRGRSRERSRERSPDRPRDRSRERRELDERKRKMYLGGFEKKPVVPAKEKAIMSSEEIEKRLAARAESLKQEAQAKAANLNLPSYLNPSVVNPQLYAKQQEKRKLLWSSKKTEQAPTNSSMWAGTRFTGDQGGEMQAKFRRLMGIKGEGASEPSEGDVSSKGETILTELEKEFERSRAFQLSRGAGGKSGVGLGYAPANYN